jgi:surface antigen
VNVTPSTDDETLIAYADGELDAEVAAQIEQELGQNAVLARRVAGYQQDAALLRSALQSTLYAPPRALPPLELGARTSPRWRRVIAGRTAPWALAASLAALALGMSLDRILDGSAVLAPDAGYVGPVSSRYGLDTLEASLELSVSGVSTAWRNPDSGASGEVTPVRTFKTSDGRYCREYREVQRWAGGREETGGIACRQGDGMWKVRIRYYPD